MEKEKKQQLNSIVIKLKYEIVKSKISIDFKGKFKINRLGEIVNKQNMTNFHNMCKYMLLFYQKEAL